MTSPAHWRRGETIVQRFVGSASGTLIASPHVVVEDTAARTILYQPEGTEILRWHMTDRVERPPMIHRMEALRFVYPHRAYYVTLWFDAGTGIPPWYEPHFGGAHSGRFRGWKVDMAAPHRRTELGFDTTDDVLDLIVRPDRTWYTKDNDDLTGFTRAGVYTEGEAARIRDVCREVVPLVETQASPFDEEWTDWQPSPDLVIGPIPAGWRELPGGDIHLSTLNYELNLPGRHYDAWRKLDSPPLWSWRNTSA